MSSRLPLAPAQLYQLLDWFMPDALKEDRYVAQRVRMFLISHLFGPAIGHLITAYLFLIDASHGPHLWVLAGSITFFWAFPFVLKLFGGRFNLLALASVQNLTFVVLWGSYHYGGVSSPFLMWLLVIPLLGFFYLGSSWFARLALVTIIGLSVAVFYLTYLFGHSFPERVPLDQMVGAGVVSTLCASIYVFMMAIYYANIVDSQSELEKEIQRHRTTMQQLLEAKEEAERANGAKSEFLAKMSHELRTPLNAVIGYSEILLEDAELDGRGEDIADLQKINAAGKHLLAMVTDVLDLSKIEAGKMELYAEEIDLASFLDEVAATCRPMVAKNANELIVERAADLGVLEADATKLRQALLNLLGNAGKFTENGRVTLSAVREKTAAGEWICISVRDTGIGLSEEDKRKLFENFSQARPTIAAKYGGTGLGLSLSRRLCRLMGGDISVESEFGQGACFTIRLPADPVAVESAARAARAAATPRAAGRIALVIDADHEALQRAERLLALEGFQAALADDAEAGLRLARTMRPALILLDLGPAGGGLDALSRLEADGVAAPVLAMGGMEPAELAANVAGRLAKPLDGAELREALRRLPSAPSREAGPAEAAPLEASVAHA